MGEDLAARRHRSGRPGRGAPAARGRPGARTVAPPARRARDEHPRGGWSSTARRHAASPGAGAMMMGPRLRKLALSVHLTCSVGWIGAVVAYLALGVAATSRDGSRVRAAWIAMEWTGWFAIVPLAIGALSTGLIMALGTKWGLFRHYWVLFSFALTTFATVILVLHMPTVSALAEVAREATDPARAGLGGDLAHPGLGLVVLLVVQVLNLYKPPGMTRYGQRKQRAQARREPGRPR